MAGADLHLRERSTSEAVREADGYCIIVPNFIAWLFSHVGTFTYDGQLVAPLMPPVIKVNNVDPQGASLLACDFNSICNYIATHAEGAAGADIPAQDRPFVNQLVLEGCKG